MFDAATMRIIPSVRLCRVHLFRHGEVQGTPGRTCRGQSDVPLSERGLGQSARAADWVRARIPTPDRVISSDLTRCATLAQAIRPDAELVPAVREQHMGDWDGHTWEELSTRDPAGTSAYWDDYVNARPPNGESYGDVFRRVTTWWDAADLEGRVVLVTHIGVIRALMCHWMGMGPGQALRWAPGYATHSQVILAEAGAVIERFGEDVAG